MSSRDDLAREEKEMGTLKTIIMLHGWAYDTEKWDPFVDCLTKFGYKVILPNIPGLTKAISRPWTINDYVDWLDSIVNKEKKEVVLLGHSNGGRISLSYCQKYPDKVSELILIDSAGIYHDELSISLKRYIFKMLSCIGKKITTSEQIRKLFYKFTGESDYVRARGVTKETMQNLIHVDLSDYLSDIKTKTLIIWGEHDTITPLSDGEFMHKRITDSKFEIVKGARHSPQFTHTDKVCRLISKFI